LDMEHFAEVNKIMKTYFHEPYPARIAIAVHALPWDAQIELEAVMAL
ncbi:MAG: RidA family protein, partial [Cardiobacterium sp.]